ncbi:phospholipase A2 group XV isoform X2 [Bufo bufo]|uniref:phospholipase A2 group XV isoform X2 n=1 Tax=Bufo bufo TaxID=8384 RepID=UPI001ABEB37C|nr:phospholipase A2 group XV isoform X2 [Bufo bufo]
MSVGVGLSSLAVVFLLWLPAASSAPACSSHGCTPGPPVVLVPGDLGNQLEAKLDKPSVVHYMCSKKTDYYFTLWLNLELLLPLVIDCWIDNIRLVFNTTTRRTASPEGVDVRVPGFGQTYSLEFLDPSKRSVGTYFYALVQSMVDWGYTRDGNVKGAPYDWRKAPNMYFTGDNNRIPVISSLRIRDQQRSAVSTSWLLPYENTWPSDKVFVQTPTVNYTLKDYEKFYRDIGFQEGWVMRKETESLVSSLTPPGVAVHCLYGTEVDTSESFHYDSFPDKEPSITNGPGDGTVNIESALQCRKWLGLQKQPVSLVELPGNEHIAMLSNVTTLAYIKKVLLGV